MAESGRSHLSRGELAVLSQVKRDLERELGRRPDYRDQARIDAELARHGIHFHAANEETIKDYVREAVKRGVSYHTRRTRRPSEDSGRTGD